MARLRQRDRLWLRRQQIKAAINLKCVGIDNFPAALRGHLRCDL